LKRSLECHQAVESRVAALWTLEKTGKLTADVLAKLIGDASPAIRKNALKLVHSLRGKRGRETRQRHHGPNWRIRKRASSHPRARQGRATATKPLSKSIPA